MTVWPNPGEEMEVEVEITVVAIVVAIIAWDIMGAMGAGITEEEETGVEMEEVGEMVGAAAIKLNFESDEL